jgi:Flp pilus assembly protein TadG
LTDPRARWLGQATLEFALATVLIVGSTLALTELGWFVYARYVVATAVAEGARVASAADRSPEDGAGYARQLLTAGLGGGAAALGVAATLDGDDVVVEAHGQLPLVVAWPGGGTPALNARVAVPKERFRPAGQRP